MEDLIARIREALDETERIARGVEGERWYFDLIEDGKRAFEDHVTSDWVLRQVAADRELIDDCVEVIGDANMSGYGQFGWLKDHPNALAVTLAVETIRNRAEAYGITVEVTA